MCIRVPGGGKGTRRRGEVRTFSALTSGLLAMRDWLLAQRITVVGMEATGSYWKPVFYLLEHDMECWLLNVRRIKAVPGRKTDVKDAEWIAKLVEHGLVRPSFVPPEPIRQLRDLTRYRTDVVRERAREAQRLQNLLEDCGIKLSSRRFASHVCRESRRLRYPLPLRGILGLPPSGKSSREGGLSVSTCRRISLHSRSARPRPERRPYRTAASKRGTPSPGQSPYAVCTPSGSSS
ncbi:transposase [Streptomyces sp. NBC_00005]|uniref:IS110 family transposase n=1 Tax=Streptomyces sp. NBC_00005 TaxID=2903609 RepID=UPI0032532819